MKAQTVPDRRGTRPGMTEEKATKTFAGRARAGHASLMRPMRPLPTRPFACCRYAEARMHASTIIAACCVGGNMPTSAARLNESHLGPHCKSVKPDPGSASLRAAQNTINAARTAMTSRTIVAAMNTAKR